MTEEYDYSSEYDPAADEVAETVDISLVGPRQTLGEDDGDDSLSWAYEGLDAAGLLFEDGFLQARITPSAAEMLSDGGSVRIDVPDGADEIDVVVRDQPMVE